MLEQPDELSSEIKAELERLPRERTPGQLLEERTVKELRSRGLLRSPRMRPSWIVVAAAASIALFAGGFGLGQWTTSRNVGDALVTAQQITAQQIEARERTAMEAAELVQRTGSAYVLALASLASMADSARNGELDQGREVATAALYAAAGQLVSLIPDDPIAVQIRRLLSATQLPGEQESSRRVVWF
jgi:hypothetical protein